MNGSIPADGRLMTVADAARRLGVKPATVYAYVSRGLLRRHPSSVHHRSLFEADDLERLASRARHQNRSGALEVVVETHLTALDPDGRLYYRGRDVTELARLRSFESVTGLLWDGDSHAPWELDTRSRQMIAEVEAALPNDTDLPERIPPAIAALATTDPHRGDRHPNAVRQTGARILAGVLAALAAQQEPMDRTAAARLWAALAPHGERATSAQMAAINAGLVLLADHELAASTLAARVAASAWANPYRVVLAGLGPLDGPLHGRAALAVESLLRAVRSPDAAFAVLDQAAAAGQVPGFGHRVYRDRDPRADHLLDRLPAISQGSKRLARVQAALAAAGSLGLPAPNVDFGLAAAAYVMRLRPGAATTIFTVARTAGLIAHALEEYPHRLRFRPRATYVGEAPR